MNFDFTRTIIDGIKIWVEKKISSNIHGLASEEYVNDSITNLVDSAPESLNTLGKLASAIDDNKNSISTVSSKVDDISYQINEKADVTHIHSYNDLTDKPFGIITHKVSNVGFSEDDIVANDMVKVSDEVIPPDCFPDAIMRLHYGDQVTDVRVGDEPYYLVDTGAWNEFLWVAYKTPFVPIGGVVIKEVGIYLPAVSAFDVEVEVLWEETKNIDSTYIGDDIARIADMPEIVNVDATLSAAGSAADAKAVGDAIVDLNTKVGDTAVAEQINTALAEIPQADWNQNDEMALDYVKNRTHYDNRSYINTEEITSSGTTVAMGFMKVSDTIDFDPSKINSLSLHTSTGIDIVQSQVTIMKDIIGTCIFVDG